MGVSDPFPQVHDGKGIDGYHRSPTSEQIKEREELNIKNTATAIRKRALSYDVGKNGDLGE